MRWQHLRTTAATFISSNGNSSNRNSSNSSNLLTLMILTSLIMYTEQLATTTTTTTTTTAATTTTMTTKTTRMLMTSTTTFTNMTSTTPAVAAVGVGVTAATPTKTKTKIVNNKTILSLNEQQQQQQHNSNRHPFETIEFYKYMNAGLFRPYANLSHNGSMGAGIYDEYPDEFDMSGCSNAQNVIVKLITMILYAAVCIVGLFGNTLVIYVVLRFSKMQTVTNIYILNLAIADECFLIGIPFLIYTMQIGNWTFGEYMCKAYMVSTSITQFTSSIFLLIMSADRYIAVCHPISSPRYRTPFVSKVVSAIAWMTSALLMLPVILFANTVPQGEDRVTCNIEWPESLNNQSDTTFILYTLVLGFATPLTFILIFYYLVIRKLHTVGPKNKSKEKKRSHRKVTKLVLTVITVYIMCWLPYWISQVALINKSQSKCASRLEVAIFLLCGCLTYSNSAMNPILYAFLSDNFKKSFMKACTCAARKDVNAQLQLENSLFPKFGKGRQSERLIGANVADKNCCTKTKQKKCLVTRNNNAANSTTTTTTTTTTTGGTATTYADGITCVYPAVHAAAAVSSGELLVPIANTGGSGGGGGYGSGGGGGGASATLLVVSSAGTENTPLEHSSDSDEQITTGNGLPPVLHTDL